MSSATEFSTNTVPRETAISSSDAFAIGPTAAMALPPQIAVPALISRELVSPTCNRLAQSEAEEHRKRDAYRGINKSRAACVNDFLQIHSEAEADHGSLQQKLGEMFASDLFWILEMPSRNTVRAPGPAEEKRSRSRKQSGQENIAFVDSCRVDLPLHETEITA